VVVWRERDAAIVALGFPEGSVATIVYADAGSPASGKERVEAFAGDVSFVLDDFRSLEVHGLRTRGTRTRAIEKGQRQQLENFSLALRGEADLGVTADDGYWATWCAEQVLRRA